MKIENLHSENCKTPVKFYASHLLKTIKRTSALSKFIAMQKQVSLRSNFISSSFNLFFNLAALKKGYLIHQTKDCLLINPVKLNESN